MSDDRVVFNIGDADRIARVVRHFESGDRNEQPLRFRRVTDPPRVPPPLKLGTFTADWQTQQYQVVTFYNVTSTPNTANVLNLTTPSIGFTTVGSTSRFVIFGNVKYTADQVAVAVEQAFDCFVVGGINFKAEENFDDTVPQILGHDGECWKWYDVFTCATTATA
jgi:hypothetical protein